MCVGYCETHPMQNINSSETGRYFGVGVFGFHNGVIVVGVLCSSNWK